MTTTLRLPPSGRDFEVFRAVSVIQDSTRAVAAAFQISQTRVRQIVSRVGQWLAETLPQLAELATEKLLNFARHLAADRLEYLYGELLRRWRETTAPRYLTAATRVAMALARHGVVGGQIETLAADAIEGPLPEDGPLPEVLAEQAAAPPPAEDCSPARPALALPAPAAAAATHANSTVANVCRTPAAAEEPLDPTFLAMLRTLRSRELTPPPGEPRLSRLAEAPPPGDGARR